MNEKIAALYPATNNGAPAFKATVSQRSNFISIPLHMELFNITFQNSYNLIIEVYPAEASQLPSKTKTQYPFIPKSLGFDSDPKRKMSNNNEIFSYDIIVSNVLVQNLGIFQIDLTLTDVDNNILDKNKTFFELNFENNFMNWS